MDEWLCIKAQLCAVSSHNSSSRLPLPEALVRAIWCAFLRLPNVEGALVLANALVAMVVECSHDAWVRREETE